MLHHSTSILRLLRPKQWSKNLLVLAAALFSGFQGHAAFVLPTAIAFLAICLVCSATYVFNDLIDVEKDRAHPVKRNRPIAAGEIAPHEAMVIGLLCLFGGVTLSATLGRLSLLIVLTYLILQVSYNLRLKQIPVADVYTIAIGFVLRAVLGAAAIHVSLSGWLLFCTGSLALMLGFAKRRNEFVTQGEDRSASRPSLALSKKEALDALVVIFSAASSICYAIYSLDSRTARKYPAVILTSVFVFYGISRYVWLVFSADEGGEPADVLFKDGQIQLSLIGFVATAVIALSGLEIPILEH